MGPAVSPSLRSFAGADRLCDLMLDKEQSKNCLSNDEPMTRDLMVAHIALLRAVNLGGKTMVEMAELRTMAEAIGFAGVRTLQQSGNLVFETRERPSTTAIENTLEAEAEKRFGRPIDFFVRDA